MRQPTLVLAFAASAAAWARRSTSEESWTPAQETSVAELNQAQLAMGISPRPTDGPAALMGRMLVPRIDDFTLGPKTCGFQSSDGVSITCITDGATCTYQSSHIGCCRPNENCNIVKTTCMDYDAVSAGSCNLPDDFHTLCCTNAARGACYTWIMSTTGTDDESFETFTAFDCAETTGTGILLDYDPNWAKTHIFSSTSKSAKPTTSDASGGGSNSGNESNEDNNNSSSSNSNNGDKDGGSSTNVGAIAGGAAGGGVALALIGAAIFFCLRRKKKNAAAKSPETQSQGATPPVVPSTIHSPMSQSAPEPYWSGVPPNPQPYQQPPQPQYDPHASMYSQQGYNQQYPPQQFQAQYANPHQSYQQGQYPQQASPVSYHGSSPGSPPPLTTPSPGVGGAPPPPPQGNVNELQAVNPVGHESNRAELGPQ